MNEEFQSVIRAFVGQPDIETSRMFGSNALKVGGKVFAMAVKGELVVKLSEERARELVEQGAARKFDPGHGRAMKQWVAVERGSPLDWLALSEEAHRSAAGLRKRT